MFYVVIYAQNGEIYQLEELDDMHEVVALSTLAAMSRMQTLMVDERTFNRMFKIGPENYYVDVFTGSVHYRHSFALA